MSTPLESHFAESRTLATGTEISDSASILPSMARTHSNPPVVNFGSTTEEILLEHVQTVLQTYLTTSPIYKLLLSSLVLLSAPSAGYVTLKLIVLPVHVNSKGVLHGSLSATIIDLVGGLAIASTGSKTGISTDMHVTFVGGAREGDTLWIEGIAERVGQTLAFTRVRIEKGVVDNEASRSLVATGSHTKYVRG